MKKFFTPCIAVVLFCSCNTYQYITLSSPDIKRNYRHQFVMENDTMKLLYDFNGFNGPMKITVYNKLDKPLMIDLNKSALIMNDEAIGLNNGNMQVSNSVSVSTIGTSSVASGSSDASAILPQGSLFVPSNTFVTRATVMVADEFLPYPPKDSSGRAQKTAHFTRYTSPMFFKTYLTFTDPEKKETTLQHQFYVSKITQTGKNPFKMGYYGKLGGDEFYVSRKKHGLGSTAGVLALTTLATTALLIATTVH